MMSLLDRANRLSGYLGEPKHWEYGWYSPAKEGSNLSDDKQKLRFKTWRQADASMSKCSYDDSDVLCLSDFDRSNTSNVKSFSRTDTSPESLSINDIRGAVGGTDIPGFSSSDAQKDTQVETENSADEKNNENLTVDKDKKDLDGDTEMQ